MALPYQDDPYIGETERAKRRKLAPRGTGTGEPGIEEGGALARQPAGAYLLGANLPQQALAQQPAVAPRAPVPLVGQQPRAPAGSYMLGVGMPQVPAAPPAPLPGPAVPPAAIETQTPPPAASVQNPTMYGRNSGMLPTAPDQVSRAQGFVMETPSPAPTPPQQIAAAAPTPTEAQPVTQPPPAAPPSVASQTPGKTLSFGNTWPPVPMDNPEAGPISDLGYTPPQGTEPGRFTVTPQSQYGMNDRGAGTVSPVAPLAQTTPQRDVGDRGAGATVTPEDKYGPSASVPIPAATQAAAANAATRDTSPLGRAQEQALSALAAPVDDATRMNAPWHTEYTRMMAEKKAGEASQAQFFNDEAERNRRIAAAPGYRELEMAKREDQIARMSGIGRNTAAAHLNALQKAYSDAQAPETKRNLLTERIATGAAADARATAAQTAAQAERMHPIALAKGLQDISTARTGEQAAKQQIAMTTQRNEAISEMHDAKTPPERRKQLNDMLLTMAGKDAKTWKAVPIRQTNDLGQVNDSVLLYNEDTNERQVISGAPGAGPSAGAGAFPPKGASRTDAKGNKQVSDGTKWVDAK